MHFSTALFFSLAATALAAPFAAPQETGSTAAAGSKKNTYLTTCTSRGLLGLSSSTSSQVLYYNGPSGGRNSPADVGTVADPARKWEGGSRSVRLDAGLFTSSIADDADDLPKSSIAGSAKLGDESLVCFRDGSTTFQFSSGLLGLGSTTCKADYWCGSIEVGN